VVNDRLIKQIQFIVEVDKLKHVYRQTLLMDGSRNENDAEHSWHLSIMAILLSEYAEDKSINILRVIKMVIIHDLIEIYAGDTFCYDEEAGKDKPQREKAAAGRLFNMLPADQSEEFHSLWEEFEDRVTSEAKFAAALDRIQPLLHNYHTNGHTWRKYNIKSDKVYERNIHVKEASGALWEYISMMIEDCIEKGLLER